MNLEAVLLSVLLVLLSAILKSGITNTGGTAATAWEIGLGLPIDLSFVSFSLVLTASSILPNVAPYKTSIAIAILVLAIIQLIFLYRPSKGYYDACHFAKAFFTFFFNLTLTTVCLGLVLIKVLSL